MKFNPKAEPCAWCGREPEECVCVLAPDVPEEFDPLDEGDPDGYMREWGKEKKDESAR